MRITLNPIETENVPSPGQPTSMSSEVTPPKEGLTPAKKEYLLKSVFLVMFLTIIATSAVTIYNRKYNQDLSIAQITIGAIGTAIISSLLIYSCCIDCRSKKIKHISSQDQNFAGVNPDNGV